MSEPFDFFQQNGYNQGFCECFKDPVHCIATWCCPCLMVGLIKGQLDNKGFDLWSCLCLGIGAYRIRRYVQTTFNLTESEDGSMCAIGLLGCCAVTQDAHELTFRGRVNGLTGSHPASQPSTTAAPAATETPAK